MGVMQTHRFILVLVFISATTSLLGCLWDKDTLAAEQARFPEIVQLITGSFPRHSREFHEWRVKSCEQLIAAKKDVPITHDDLAVSQHKLGNHKAAIATMQRKEKLFPGEYETYSNLGTFFIYTGQLDEAARHIRKALAINENAHFGREKYQLWLVEWLQSRNTSKPENKSDRYLAPLGQPRGFVKFLATKVTLNEKERGKALRGVLGMMWFADYDNPLLLEALGDLLIFGSQETNAAQLAAMSYLRAAQKTTDEAEKKRLSEHSSMAVKMTEGPYHEPSNLSKLLNHELAKGREYAESVRKDELAWIAEGANAGELFQKKYWAE